MPLKSQLLKEEEESFYIRRLILCAYKRRRKRVLKRLTLLKYGIYKAFKRRIQKKGKHLYPSSCFPFFCMHLFWPKVCHFPFGAYKGRRRRENSSMLCFFPLGARKTKKFQIVDFRGRKVEQYPFKIKAHRIRAVGAEGKMAAFKIGDFNGISLWRILLYPFSPSCMRTLACINPRF